MDTSEAEVALEGALMEIGVESEIQPATSDSWRFDLIAALPSGEQIPLEVKVTAAGDSQVIKQWVLSREPGVTKVVVADRLSERLRAELTNAGPAGSTAEATCTSLPPGCSLTVTSQRLPGMSNGGLTEFVGGPASPMRWPVSSPPTSCRPSEELPVKPACRLLRYRWLLLHCAEHH